MPRTKSVTGEIILLTDMLRTPSALAGTTKYGSTGSCTANQLLGLQLPSATLASLAQLGNYGIATGTWSSYKTAQKMLDMCQKHTEHDMSLPLSTPSILAFIHWLTSVRGVKAGTIHCYLAGVRQLHIIRGLEPPPRSELTKLVLKGIANKEGITKRSEHTRRRLPITLSMMRLIKHLLKQTHFSTLDKSMLWACCTLAFAGAFRIHELLCKNESYFDPAFTLLGSDITWCTNSDNTQTLHIKLKCPKESRSAAPTIVDIFQSRGDICPVSAFFRWRDVSAYAAHLPLFVFQSGTPLTGRKLNTILERMLKPHVDDSLGYFRSHSFRAGLASELAKLGFDDEDIQAAGRWSSRAFENYIKLTRTKRAAIGRTISKISKRR